MGALDTLSGVIYFDANCFIYSVERIEPYRTLLQTVWERAKDGHCHIITSELALLETLVKPLKLGDATLENGFRALLQQSNEVTLTPISLPILERTARVRAVTNLKTPDAIHAATALISQCAQFITNDAGFRRVPNLPVLLLSEIAQAQSTQNP